MACGLSPVTKTNNRTGHQSILASANPVGVGRGHTRLLPCIYSYAHAFIHTHAYSHAFTHILPMHSHAYIHHTRMHSFAHTYSHAFTHTHTHTHTYSRAVTPILSSSHVTFTLTPNLPYVYTTNACDSSLTLTIILPITITITLNP